MIKSPFGSFRERGLAGSPARRLAAWGLGEGTANLRTKILDFRGFDSGIISILRGGILVPVWNFSEMLNPDFKGWNSHVRMEFPIIVEFSCLPARRMGLG